MKKLIKSLVPPLVLTSWHKLNDSLSKVDPAVVESPRECTIRGGRLSGRTFLCNPDVKEYQGMMLDGSFDSKLFAEVDKDNWAGKTIYDIGSHVGYHVLNFAERVGASGKVFSFEPHPLHCKRINDNLGLNPDLKDRVTILNLALGNENGEGTFFYTNGIEASSSSMSFLQGASTPLPEARYRDFQHTLVRMAKLDDLLAQGLCAPPDLIKIDVEGAEGMVIEGATEALRKHTPKILIEVHNYPNMLKITQIFTRLGFQINILDDEWGRCFISVSHS